MALGAPLATVPAPTGALTAIYQRMGVAPDEWPEIRGVLTGPAFGKLLKIAHGVDVEIAAVGYLEELV